MRPFARALAFTVIAAASLVAVSILMYFPVVVWHRYRAPEATSLMRYRAAQAAGAGDRWEPAYEWVPIGRISPNLEAAVLAAEDSRFYQHHGFDLEQIRTAWEGRDRAGRLRGASTITQQTVKNLYLTPRRDVLRKLREAVLTAWMELWLPKRRILELYLNVVELGPGIFGAEAAARVYFGRTAAGLSRAQAALLAATLPAPLVRNPGRPTPGLRRLQGLVLRRMERWYGRPERAGEREAAREPLPVVPELRPSQPLELPGPPEGLPPPDTLADELPDPDPTPLPVEPDEPAPDTTMAEAVSP